MSNSDYDIERGVYQTPSNDDDLYDEYDDVDGFGRGPVFAIFAVIVLAAFVGIVWLAYQQGVRQGQMSSPPIIAASDDPFKVEPSDPEGMAEPEQSLTDEVLAGETLGQQPTTVTSSTEEPIETARASGDSAPELRTSDVAADNENTSPGELTVPRPSSGLSETETAAPSQEPEDEAPPEIERALAEPAQPPQDSASEREVAAATSTRAGSDFAAGGAYVVQIASVPNRGDADGVWSRITSRYGAIVEGYTQDVQAVDLGDRGTWYRLRVGYFETSADANALCNELKDAGQDCLVASR